MGPDDESHVRLADGVGQPEVEAIRQGAPVRLYYTYCRLVLIYYCSHYHRPMLHFMRNGDALYQITINFPPHMKTFKQSEQTIIQAAIEVLRLSDDQASELRWYRNGS